MRMPSGRIWVLTSATLLSACTAALPPPETPPMVVARRDAVPDPGATRVTLRASLPLSGVEALARQHLALPRADDFTRVSGAGANPEVEARYASSLDGVHFQSRGHTLEVRADVQYHATLRARAKTPFGRIWLTKGTAWGTAAKPGRMEITLRSRMEVKPDWSLRSHTELKGVKLTAPEMKKVCSRGAFSLCIDAAWVEAEIHRRLKAAAREKVQAALADLDAGLAAQVPLRQGAQSLWQGLSEAGARLGLVPVALAVGPPQVHGDSLGLDLRVEARPHAAADGQVGGLPPARSDLEGDDALPVTLALDWATLAAGFAASLPRALGDDGWSLAAVEVRGAAADAGRYWIAARLAQGEREQTVHLSGLLVVDGDDALAWRELQLTDPSGRWLAEVRLDQALERELTALRAEVGDGLRAQAARVGSSLAGAAGLWPLRWQALERVSVGDVYAVEGGVVVTGVLR